MQLAPYSFGQCQAAHEWWIISKPALYQCKNPCVPGLTLCSRCLELLFCHPGSRQ